MNRDVFNWIRLLRSPSNLALNVPGDGYLLPLWATFPVFHHPHHKKKKNLPFIQSKFTLFWFKTVSLVLSQALKTNWKVCSVAYQMQYNLKWNQPGNSPFGSVEQCICICFTRSVQVWNKKTWTAYEAEVSAVTASIIYPVTSLSNANITGDWSCLVLRSFSSVV